MGDSEEGQEGAEDGEEDAAGAGVLPAADAAGLAQAKRRLRKLVVAIGGQLDAVRLVDFRGFLHLNCWMATRVGYHHKFLDPGLRLMHKPKLSSTLNLGDPLVAGRVHMCIAAARPSVSLVAASLLRLAWWAHANRGRSRSYVYRGFPLSAVPAGVGHGACTAWNAATGAGSQTTQGIGVSCSRSTNTAGSPVVGTPRVRQPPVTAC